HPRQVLSVVTRLLDGERIRQQRLARDFVARFRELEGRRGSALAWREWIEFVVELSRWEVRLAASNEPGLSEALHSLQTSLRKDFAGYVARQYPRWLAHPADRDTLRPQRDLLRHVSDGDRRATPRLVGPGLGRGEPQRARSGAPDRAAAGAGRGAGPGALREAVQLGGWR